MIADLSRLSSARSRSLSPENPTGGKGQGALAEPDATSCSRELGKGWKIRPCIQIKAGETVTIAGITGPGTIQQMWMTPTGNWRFQILRIYWDDQVNPSVEVPLGDFFCCGFGTRGRENHIGENFRQLSSLMVCVNPGTAFNCYWSMPFRTRCRMTVTNIEQPVVGKPDERNMTLFYQINYEEGAVANDAAYFHTTFRRNNPVQGALHTLLDGVHGRGHYVGTAMAWGVNNNGWWGEGEIKFFMDGDAASPTICGTGTEDYFCGSYNFDVGKEHGGYREFCTPYAGMHQVLRSDGLYRSQQRFGLYRWHITEPIRFEKDLKVTIQDLGWRCDGRYLPQQSDIASVSYWYQTLPTAPFPALPDRNYLEII